MTTIPGVSQNCMPDGSMLAVFSDDQLVRAFPLPVDLDAIEKQAAARYLASPGRAVTMVSDQTHQPCPIALFYFIGHQPEREDGFQLMIASASGSLAAKEVRRAVHHWKRWGGR
jgi:hypothetical protein